MRNYFNAIVEYKDKPDQQTEIIIKVGEVDYSDDMHVDEYVSSEEELEKIKNDGHPDFKLIEYWQGIRPNQKPVIFDKDDFDDFMQNKGKYSWENFKSKLNNTPDLK